MHAFIGIFRLDDVEPEGLTEVDIILYHPDNLPTSSAGYNGSLDLLLPPFEAGFLFRDHETSSKRLWGSPSLLLFHPVIRKTIERIPLQQRRSRSSR